MSSRTKIDRSKVADQIHSAAIHLLRRLRKSDVRLGISATRLSALSVLVFGGDKTLGELAATEQVTPPTMSKLIQALAADKFVTRSGVASDRRAVRVRATAKGRRALKRGRQLRVTELAELMRSLPADDIVLLSQAAAILEKLAAR